MEAAQHIVKLGPVAVEVVDRTLIELARDIAMFRPVMETYVRGKPDALLLVEFAEDDQAENLRRLDRLDELMGDLGHPSSVVKVADAAGQKAVWEVRASGLNIMMSMKSEGKPVSFIEDCAVPLEHLADYTERLTAVFEKHGTKGTWYAHASVGCLHVRPVLNLKLEKDAKTMRAIAEEAFAMVKEYKGSHSGEHGDGLVRSEFHEKMYGRKTVEIFEEVKDRFDPGGLMNPGKIVRASAMNDRTLFRYKPDYRVPEFETALDWSAYPGAGGGFQGAVEMCNNNGECRKHVAGVMCPSFRITGNERDLTRGRANTLRLAISGQLGPDAFASDEMLETMKLCVSCKGCRRECPTGVDMAKMKIEVLAAANKRRGLSLRDRLVAYLPRYAPYAARLAPLMNLRNGVPVLAALDGARHRLLRQAPAAPMAPRLFPRLRSFPLSRLRGEVGVRGSNEREASVCPSPPPRGRAGTEARVGHVALFADTFNTYFEPENLHAAVAVLTRLGYRVTVLAAGSGRARAVLRAHLPLGRPGRSGARRGPARAGGRRADPRARRHGGRARAVLPAHPARRVHLHAAGTRGGTPGVARRSCSRNSWPPRSRPAASRGRSPPTGPPCFCTATAIRRRSAPCRPSRRALGLVEGLTVETVESSCCGMAGAFGYGADTHQASVAMGELSLLPAVRKAAPDAADRRRRLFLPPPDPRRHRPHRPACLAHIVRCDGRHARQCGKMWSFARTRRSLLTSSRRLRRTTGVRSSRATVAD